MLTISGEEGGRDEAQSGQYKHDDGQLKNYAYQQQGGWVVMLDDVLAGFYALLLLLAGKSLFL